MSPLFAESMVKAQTHRTKADRVAFCDFLHSQFAFGNELNRRLNGKRLYHGAEITNSAVCPCGFGTGVGSLTGC